MNVKRLLDVGKRVEKGAEKRKNLDEKGKPVAEEKKENAVTETNVPTTTQEVNEEDKNWKEFEVFAEGNTMAEMKFNIGSISVDEGDWVRVILENKGVDVAMIHNIVFVKYGTRKEVAMQSMNAGPEQKYVARGPNVIAYSDLADPGETVTLEFEAPKKGNYECKR